MVIGYPINYNNNSKNWAAAVPGGEASMGDDGVVAGGQEGKVVPNRILVLTIAFS